MPDQKEKLVKRKTAFISPPIEMTGKLDDKFLVEAGSFAGHDRPQISVKESEVRYRRLFETAKDGILILDGDTGRIVDANPFLQDMLGYPESDLIGKALWEIGSVRDIPASQEAMRELQKNEYIRYEDIPLETKAGEIKHVEFVSNVYLVDGWRVIQCNIRDITERKHAETQLVDANENLLALVNELQRRDKESQLLNQMNDLLQSCMTEAEAYQVITLKAGELFPGQNGCLAILRKKGNDLETVACWGPDQLITPAFVLEDCWALRRGQMHEVADPQNGLLCRHFNHRPQAGYLCLPLTVHGQTLGVLCLIEGPVPKSKHQLSLQQLALTFGETIKLSLSNLKLRDALRQQAILDTLTGLFNRRYLDETLPRELHRAQRLGAPLSVVMLDIDGFKQFNDSFGHASGDSLLREFGLVMREHLRKSDISCRYGGDEFVLILPDSSADDAEQRVEQIRRVIKELRGEQMLDGITMSAGIAHMPEHGITEPELLLAADEALYAAKQAGRDRIVVHQKKSPR